MIGKLRTVFYTVRHLKPTQLLHQVKYRLVKPKPLRLYGTDYQGFQTESLRYNTLPPVYPCWDGRGKFVFLNLTYHFEGEIDWNHQSYGKLWNYNLQYANYLLQSDVSDNAKIALMRSQYEWLSNGRLPLEPYPVSLRIINMIRWLSAGTFDDTEFRRYLYAELDFLAGRLEYHLLGNHLLENAFALLMGGAFFGKTAWVSTAQELLKGELAEQILTDGAHFELSPMYHQIIFFRVLELIDWYSNWEKKDVAFEALMRNKAADMARWLANISFSNGDIPLFNDSAYGVAYPTRWLLQYADRLSIVPAKRALGESGYRSIARGDYELKIDFAQVGPIYQPGHAHADALSFILYYKNKPLFVEQGTSTYQIGPRRNLERSTQAHNTVVVNNSNQSEVWGGFRVARRARTTILKNGEKGIYEAKHDGYRRYGVEHIRSFQFQEAGIIIEDYLSKTADAVCFLHLCPTMAIHEVLPTGIVLSNGARIVFEGADNVIVEGYEYADSYNAYHPAKRIKIQFKKHLKSAIYFEESR